MIRFLRFSLVGVVNSIIHLCLFYLLFAWWGWFHLLASATGFVAAVINSYLMNRYWTFQADGRPGYAEFYRFVVVSLTGLLVNLLSMWLLVEWLSLLPLPAQVISIGFTLVFNFLGYQYWSFRPHHGT